MMMSPVLFVSLIALGTPAAATPSEAVVTHEFALAQPFPTASVSGGLFVHDLNGDGRMDFVVSCEGHVGATAIQDSCIGVIN